MNIRIVDYTSEEELLANGVITPEEYNETIRARAAIRFAIEKAKICKKPVAKYNHTFNKAYLEYPDGYKEIVN